jgi:hypothetical protein
MAATLARGKTRRSRDKVNAEIEQITRKPWVRRVLTWQLTGQQPPDLRLTWAIDPAARAALEELFGKHILITDHDTWPVPEIVAGYRSQSEAEFTFRQLNLRLNLEWARHRFLDRWVAGSGWAFGAFRPSWAGGIRFWWTGWCAEVWV